jgi:hypothetical protein
VVPIHYLWRPYQLVIWNGDRHTLRGQAPRATPKVAETAASATGETVAATRPLVTG